MRRLGSMVVSMGLVLACVPLAAGQETDVAELAAVLPGDSGPEAADALARLGPSAKTAVPALSKRSMTRTSKFACARPGPWAPSAPPHNPPCPD